MPKDSKYRILDSSWMESKIQNAERFNIFKIYHLGPKTGSLINPKPVPESSVIRNSKGNKTAHNPSNIGHYTNKGDGWSPLLFPQFYKTNAK